MFWRAVLNFGYTKQGPQLYTFFFEQEEVFAMGWFSPKYVDMISLSEDGTPHDTVSSIDRKQKKAVKYILSLETTAQKREYLMEQIYKTANHPRADSLLQDVIGTLHRTDSSLTDLCSEMAKFRQEKRLNALSRRTSG